MHDRLSPAPPCRACHVSPALRGVRAPSSAPTRASWRAASRPARHAHAMRPSMRSVGRPPPSGQHRVFLRAPAKPDIAMRTAPARPAVTRVSQPAQTLVRRQHVCHSQPPATRRAAAAGQHPLVGSRRLAWLLPLPMRTFCSPPHPAPHSPDARGGVAATGTGRRRRGRHWQAPL